MSLQTCTYADATAAPATFIARESRIRRVTWPFALSAIGAILVAAANMYEDYFVLLWPGIFFIGFGIITMSFALPGLRLANWAVRATEKGIYLNPLSTPTGERINTMAGAIFIPFTAIEQAHRVYARNAFVYPNERTHISHQHLLAITLRGADDVQGIIDPMQHIETGEDADWIVRAAGPNEIRIQWKGPGIHLVPSMARAMTHLGEHAAIGSDVQETDAYANRTRHEALDRRLEELCAQGKTRQAVSVARERYGLSLADAILHVEDLMAKHRPERKSGP